MAFVRTVPGDIVPQQMGITYSHELEGLEEYFLTIANKNFILNDTEKITVELKIFYNCGGRTLVDTMPANCGCNVLKFAEVSKLSNVNIITPTSIYLKKYYPANHWRSHLSADELTDLFIKDIDEGIDEYDYGCPIEKRTNHKAGLIKLATVDEPIAIHQQKILYAVVNTKRQTGVPIQTPTNGVKNAIEQVALFVKPGVNIKHVVLSPIDKYKDISWHKTLLQSGVYLEFDSHFHWQNEADKWTNTLLEKLLPDYAAQITIGMNMARNIYWQSYGGLQGLIYSLITFHQQIKKRGLSAYLEKIFFTNTQQLFSYNKN